MIENALLILSVASIVMGVFGTFTFGMSHVALMTVGMIGIYIYLTDRGMK